MGEGVAGYGGGSGQFRFFFFFGRVGFRMGVGISLTVEEGPSQSPFVVSLDPECLLCTPQRLLMGQIFMGSPQ